MVIEPLPVEIRRPQPARVNPFKNIEADFPIDKLLILFFLE